MTEQNLINDICNDYTFNGNKYVNLSNRNDLSNISNNKTMPKSDLEAALQGRNDQQFICLGNVCTLGPRKVPVFTPVDYLWQIK